jgi:thiamine biosynthesis lipoprotein
VNRKKKIFFLLICCFCLPGFGEQEQHSFAIRGKAQGTSYSILYYASAERIQKAEIDSILRVIDQSMSLYDSVSLISQWNRSTRGGRLDPHFYAVVRKAFDINKKTDGAFDITVGPLLKAWGFANGAKHDLPDSLAVSEMMPLIGMDKLRLGRNRLIKKRPGIQIDLNGIAQGYTVDLLAAHLEQKGVSNFLVELGGELRVEGKKSNGEDFTVGIERPLNNQDEQAKIRHLAVIRGKALTTSGTYQNFIRQGEERLSHIMDPRTGRPIRSDILSVTVLANDAITADGYDNALMAMGLEKAVSFVESFSDLEAYFVYQNSEGKLADTMTSGFKKIIKNTP